MTKIRSGNVAGIFFSESSIRYAVVNHSDGSKLERLGSCDFELNLLDELRRGIKPDTESTLTEAVSDVLGDADAQVVCVGIHPSICRTFFTLTNAAATDSETAEQFKSESQLLFGSDVEFLSVSSELHHVIAEGTDVRQNWHMVTLVPSTVKEPIDRILKSICRAEPTYMSSIEASKRLIREGLSTNGARNDFTVLVGQYSGIVEMTVLSDGNIINGQTVTPENGADYLYWLVVLATRLDISLSSISRVFYYGDALDPVMFDDIEHATHAEIVRLDPFRLVDINVGSLRRDFDATYYSSCLGMVF